MFARFWTQQISLLFGIHVVVGCGLALTHECSLLLPIALFWTFAFRTSGVHQKKRLLLALACLIAAAGFCTIHYSFPTLPKEGVRGTALFRIDSVRTSQTHFGKCWLYRGYADFGSDGQICHIPCAISLPYTAARPPADRSYQITGTLKETLPHRYILKVSSKEPWLPLEDSWSGAEWRYQAKRRVAETIEDKTPDARSARFLTGILTGDFDDQALAFDLSRFGLQHIMAVSGLHFALLAAFFHFLLQGLMTPRRSACLLMILLSLYCLFVGFNPSIVRAWIAALVFFGGHIVGRPSNGLNSLGLGLLVITIAEPLLCTQIGFQFSFLATAAILFFYPLCDLALLWLLPKRPLPLLSQMSRLQQHGYILLALTRQALALTLAVHLTALPMMLFFFHRFPWMSLAYNLFFPFLVGPALILLLAALLLGPLGDPLFWLNSAYTRFLLDFTSHLPASLDLTWRVAPLPAWPIVAYLSGLFTAGIFLRGWAQARSQTFQDLKI